MRNGSAKFGKRLGYALLCLLVLASQSARGLDPRKQLTQYVQTVLADKAGLPESSVNAITQTADGYIWFATEEGLARYDGQHMDVYDTVHYKDLPDNFIVSLTAGRDNSLWIATRTGALVRWKAGVFKTYASLNCIITAVHEDREGGVWVATNQGLYEWKDGRIRGYKRADGLPSDVVSGVAETSDGTVWVGTHGGLARWTPNGKTVFTMQAEAGADSIEAVAAARDGGLWIATERGIAHAVGGGMQTWPAGTMAKYGEVSSLWEDRDGTLWVAFLNNGIARLVNGHFEAYDAPRGLPSANALSTFEDRDSDMWFGTEAGVVELRDGLFTDFSLPEGLLEDAVWSVLAARDDSTWVGTASKGLNHILVDGRIETYSSKNGLHPGAIMALYEEKNGSILLGFDDGALGRLQDGHFRLVLNGDEEHASLVCITRDRNGDLLLGYHETNGLVRIHDGRQERIHHPGILNAVLPAKDGSFWISTYYAGLLHLKDGKLTSFNSRDGKSSDFMHAMHEDRDGTIWAGTSMKGLERIKNGQVTLYSVADGLFDQLVGTLLEDDLGNLWMTSNKGIFRVSKKELNEYAEGRIARIHSVVYGAAEGMRNPECNSVGLSSATMDTRGRLAFATVAGVAMIDEHRTERRSELRMLIGQVQVDALHPLSTDGSWEMPGQSAGGGLTAGPTIGNLTVNFTAPNFIAPERMRFRYRLKEFDKEWTEAGNRRQAFYTKLPPGAYEFEVEGADGDREWSPYSAHFTLTLKPYFWQTLWFRGLFSLAALLVGVAVYHLRVRYLVVQNRLLEERVEERTKELTAAVRVSELAHEALHEQATRDSLTKLWNRRCIFEILDRESLAATRRGDSLCILMADIDHFKNINDTLGHQAGDRVLMEVAQRIVQMTRSSDFAGRYGGEEFLIILPGCSLADGLVRAEEFRQAIYGTPISVSTDLMRTVAGGNGLEVTEATGLLRVSCSFGIAAGTAQPVSELLIHEADQALYSAKRAGRNRVYVREGPSGAVHGHGGGPLLVN